MTSARLGVLGVPTSAGSHNAGLEKAPAAWRSAGLVDQLRARGMDVADYGDLPISRHRPAEPVEGVRDLDRVAAVANRTAARVAEIRADDRLPVVLGGDCTITLGVVAAVPDTGLVYFDGDADLNTPATTTSAVADTMGMTHLLGGGASALANVAGRRPLMQPERVVLFGFDPAELDTYQWTQVATHHLYAAPAPAVRTDPLGAAGAARSHLEARCDRLLVHLDVDVLDTGRFPLANFPHSAGLTLDETSACLAHFLGSPKLAGLVVTEVNPDHDYDGSLLAALCAVIVDVLSPPT